MDRFAFPTAVVVCVMFVLAACQAPIKLPLATRPSDPAALAQVAGQYSLMGKYSSLFLHPDGTYASLVSSGVFTVSQDQIIFRDYGSACTDQIGVYQWAIDGKGLTLAPIADECETRATALTRTAERVQEDASMPVEVLWRSTGTPNPFVRPTSIAVDRQSNIYVVDGGNNRIQKFDTNGRFLTMWGSHGKNDGQFVFRVPPAHYGDVAVDMEGNVYATDYNQRVQKFDGDGKFLLKWGSRGDSDGQFAVAQGIAVDATGNVYVADPNNHNVQKFDSNGKFLLKWGAAGNGDGEFGGSGNDASDYGPGPGSGPNDIAIDQEGNVYTLDWGNYRIQKFGPDGKFLNKWGSRGTGDGQFLGAETITVDQLGHVYVVDNQENAGGPTNRVVEFDTDGKFLGQWGHTGTDIGTFQYPGGIAVDNQGNIYVVNVYEVLQKFGPTTRQPEKPAATAAAQKPAVAETIFSSKIYKLPMSVSFGPDWHVLDDYPDLVTLEKKQEKWELGFNIVNNAKLADPVDGHRVPFPADFVSWLKSDPSLVVGEPAEVMVGGIKGIQIDFRSTRTTVKDFLYLTSGITWNIYGAPFGRFILLNDVNGERMLIWLVLTVDADEFKDALGQAQPILDSVVFTK